MKMVLCDCEIWKKTASVKRPHITSTFG